MEKNIRFISQIIVIFFVLNFVSYSQTKTNLEIFNTLVDSSVVKINDVLAPGENQVRLNFNSGSAYNVFQNQVIYSFQKLGKKVNKDSGEVITYSIESASVNYGDMFRDGFLGSFYLPRNLKLTGNYSVEKGTINAGKFNIAFADTVAVDSVYGLENSSFPFTKGEIPSEPFFSSLLGPVVAIGSAAVAVILFFTVRSK